MSCQLLSEQDVRVVGLFEDQLQFLQLALGERRPTSLESSVAVSRQITGGGGRGVVRLSCSAAIL